MYESLTTYLMRTLVNFLGIHPRVPATLGLPIRAAVPVHAAYCA